jgi:hypothetical protein
MWRLPVFVEADLKVGVSTSTCELQLRPKFNWVGDHDTPRHRGTEAKSQGILGASVCRISINTSELRD